MRVVAGSARGRRLVAPSGRTVRPTSDRVREATFNALASRDALRGAVVLDLFAGSGALAIEALSRGAARAVLVESDRAAVEAIRANLATTGMEDRATVVRDDVVRWLQRPVPAVDVVLADPPYAFDGWDALLAAVRPALSASRIGLAVVETADAFAAPDGWDVLREQRYGGTVVTILCPVPAGGDGAGGDGRPPAASPASSAPATATTAVIPTTTTDPAPLPSPAPVLKEHP